MSKQIDIQLVLVDNMTDELKEATKGVAVETNKMARAATDAGAAISDTNRKAITGFNANVERVATLSSSMQNMANSVIRGDLAGAMQSFTQVGVNGFKTIGLQAALMTGGIGLALAGVGILIRQGQNLIENAKQAREEAKKSIERYVEITSAIGKSQRQKEILDQKKKNEDLLAEYDKGVEAKLTETRKKLQLDEDYLIEMDAKTPEWKIIEAENKITLKKEKLFIDELRRLKEERLDLEADNDFKIFAIEDRYQTEYDALKEIQITKEQEVATKRIDIKHEELKQRGLIAFRAMKREEADSKDDVDRFNLSVLREREKNKTTAQLREQDLAHARMIAEMHKQIQMQRMELQAQFIGSLAELNQATKGSAIITKALYMGQSAMNTALAVTQAMTNPLTLPLIPWIIGTGAVQMGIIAAQKFAKGGIVGGNSYSGDYVPARLNSGEGVFTREQMEELFRIAKGESQNAGMNITINASKNVNTKEIAFMLNDLARRGYFSQAYHLKRALAA